MAQPAITLNLDGEGRIARLLRITGKEGVKALERGLRAEGENLRTESMRIVPHEFGILRNTAFVQQKRSGDAFEIIVGYGTRYALFVHEIPPPEEGAPHPQQFEPGARTARHKPPTTWKYLERPALKRFAKAEDRLARRIMRKVRAKAQAANLRTAGV